ncbi:30S ribosomal protein S13 [Sedimentisphaera cyanobacteriorum]|uniref:Small ribosomal subunit protein uS13 n=1 Tax=Sedimentisphaera cyanobacteriorum TaxID=1940790 RepID=A0A1Q2HPQ7_9BACT|nr:30S ribosomal protein S13 [Sedimentisphaera cyanobacteriorum]AQQ09408.1 30S ribosomal protein S13 [Sedimentisphaera cyanobacteriorum]
MPRIVGVDVPNNKQIYFSLLYIHGIGKHYSKMILEKVGIEPTRKADQLTDEELTKVSQLITDEYEIEGQLRRKVVQDINRLKEIGCYRGFRHKRGLPCRGQQTQCNSRTRKGKKKTVAGKKSVKALR